MASKDFNVRVVVSAVDQITGKFKDINKKIANSPLTKLNNSIRQLGSAVGLNQLGKAFSNVGDAAGGVLNAVNGIGTKLLGLGAIAASGAFGIFQMAKLGDSARDASMQLGITGESYLGLVGAARIAGIGQEEFSTVLQKFSKNIGDAAAGSGEARNALLAMGIGIRDAAGNIRPLDKLLPEVADKLNNIQSASVRNAFGAKIFGKQFQELVPLLGKGSKGLSELTGQAKDLGFVLSEQAINQGDTFVENWERTKVALQGVTNIIGSAVMPQLNKLAGNLSKIFQENRPAIEAFATALAENLPETLESLGQTAGVLWSATEKLVSVFKFLGSIFGEANVAAVAFGLWLGGPLLLSVIKLGSELSNLGVEVVKVGYKFATWLLSTQFGMTATIVTSNAMSATFKRVGISAKVMWGLITGPVGLTIAAIGLVIAAGVYLYKTWKPFQELVDKIWEKMKKIGSGIANSKVAKFFTGSLASEVISPATPAAGPGSLIQQINRNNVTENQVRMDVNFGNVPHGTNIQVANPGQVPLDYSRGWALQ